MIVPPLSRIHILIAVFPSLGKGILLTIGEGLMSSDIILDKSLDQFYFLLLSPFLLLLLLLLFMIMKLGLLLKLRSYRKYILCFLLKFSFTSKECHPGLHFFYTLNILLKIIDLRTATNEYHLWVAYIMNRKTY